MIHMSSAALKPQEISRLRFRGTIQMNGVGVTSLEKRQARKHRYVGLHNAFVESAPNITCLNAQQHGEITGCCATIDPKRRVPLYYVHENSTDDTSRTYRCTKPCQDKKKQKKKTKRYRRICQAVKLQKVQNAEDTLVNSRSLDLQIFEEYLRNRTMVTELLQRHYTETTANHLTMHLLHRKLKLSKYMRRQKASEDMVAYVGLVIILNVFFKNSNKLSIASKFP
ncbi:hypothetical protein G6F46_003563 [Rhizopus delemar]|uniref:Uncharacterized protein n=2 Tax=Rhizopus TaxID=4842 RepID=A0A9P6Z2C0_9FUNG|nr:hypothetical protein G6F55_009970 [Rhizopus delemar]KAG1542143.1 hypothetical protein G6F51_007460 [Rhizopus arrhizus]KAG1495372.1 hypothetical protein G6F54_007223 [Rhizopus delemar]KAG1514765.1 hypothetical protein G6F53_003425 [Rhizopus delemar]KAG1524977.1 hypothetical protein G6F52_003731 [Rhizopus delemar]